MLVGYLGGLFLWPHPRVPFKNWKKIECLPHRPARMICEEVSNGIWQHLLEDSTTALNMEDHSNDGNLTGAVIVN